MDSSIKTVLLQVELQENGILRAAATGRFIGRIAESKEVNFEYLSTYSIKDVGNFSDGSHTFNELYEHRTILFSVICNTYKNKAWKSWKHEDGSMFKDYFIVGITTSKGDYSYHCHKDNWNRFDIKEIANAPKWDGHKPSDVNRLYYLLQENHKDIIDTKMVIDDVLENGESEKIEYQAVKKYYCKFVAKNDILPFSIERDLYNFFKILGKDLVLYAIDESIERNILNFKYIKAILNNLIKNNITTIEDAKNQKPSKGLQNVPQGDLTDDEIYDYIFS